MNQNSRHTAPAWMSPRRRPGRGDIRAGTHARIEVNEFQRAWAPAYAGVTIKSVFC